MVQSITPSPVKIDLSKIKSPKSYHCPKCDTLTDYRVHRSLVVKKLLFFMPLKRYWCPRCFNRFYVKG